MRVRCNLQAAISYTNINSFTELYALWIIPEKIQIEWVYFSLNQKSKKFWAGANWE